MPRRKYATDAERVQAIRDYHRRYYAANRDDAKNIGFDDEFFYQELNKSADKRLIPMQELLREQALVAFNEWQNKTDKIPY